MRRNSYRATILPGLAILCALLTTASVAAAGLQVELGVMRGEPRADFAENVENMAWGLSGNLAFVQPASWITVGGDLFFMNYGRETHTEELNPLTPDILIDVTTSNDIFGGHAFLRLGPAQGRWRPYLEGVLGFKYLRTETTIEYADDYPDEEPIGESTNWEDWTSDWGFGAGMLIFLTGMGDGETKADLWLSLNARYLYGGEAEYLKEGSIDTNDEDEVTYRLHRSHTDMMVITLGVTFLFDV